MHPTGISVGVTGRSSSEAAWSRGSDQQTRASSRLPTVRSATGGGTPPVPLWFWSSVPGVREEAGGGSYDAKTEATDGDI